MGKVNIDDVDKYGGGNGGNFFQLKDDMEKAKVRFMLDNIKDLSEYTYVVHNVKQDKKDKYGMDVNCLREYDDPVDMCPFCQAGLKQSVKVFVPVYNEDEETVQFWTRGKTIIGKLSGLMNRHKDFPGHIFEIERHGKKGDQKTTYEIYHDDEDDTTLDDLPEIPDIDEIGAVLEKSEDDMNYFLDEGEFPPEDDDDDEPVRKRSSKKSRRDRDEDDEDVRPRRKKASRHDDEDEEDDEPVRKKSFKSKKSKRRRDEDEF